jgi:hypothetical protein
MGLVDLRTDLKSLRFGKDRVGGGSSNQPYKTRPIPDSLSDTDVTGGPDFLLRGGTLALRNSVRDVSRLAKMFTDFKSPNGLLYTVKQNILSRTSVQTQASPTAFNNGIYLPTSTVAQAGVNALGIHLNKQGIDPTGLIAKKGILVQPSYSNHLESIKNSNRLIELKNSKINQISSNPNELRSYSGGPGSILGTIGRTRIGRDSNTRNAFDVLKLGDLFPAQNVITMDYEQIEAQDSSRNDPQVQDFRTLLTPPNSNYSNLPKTLDYSDPSNRLEQRVNLGNPGVKGNKTSYLLGKNGTNTPLDKINALPLYKSSAPIVDKIKNDLVKFRIGVIDNDDLNKKTYIHFRAFIDSMSESYSSKWNSTEFVGRGEPLYRYGGGFNRSLNLGWTVVAQSKDELIPMYQKLNYLASIIAPDYSDKGYMRGNLITLTLGGWFFEQVGFIEGITYDVPQESPWEIAIPGADGTDTTTAGIKTDKSVKEMPHMIKVTGFKFTPIQSFLPQIQKNNFAKSVFENAESNFVSSYGPQRYIQLATSAPRKKQEDDFIIADNYGDVGGAEIEGNRTYLPQNQS